MHSERPTIPVKDAGAQPAFADRVYTEVVRKVPLRSLIVSGYAQGPARPRRSDTVAMTRCLAWPGGEKVNQIVLDCMALAIVYGSFRVGNVLWELWDGRRS